MFDLCHLHSIFVPLAYSNIETMGTIQEGSTISGSGEQGRSGATTSRSLPLPTTRTAADSASSSARFNDVEASSAAALPVAQPIQATTVSDSALFHVDIDGQVDATEKYLVPARTDANQQNKSLKWKWLVAGVVVAVATIAVVLVMVLKENDKESLTIEEFPYPCFRNFIDVIEAQHLSPPGPMQEPLILCPNTYIKIGTFRNPARDDFNITGGDYPLNILRPNMTLQCGLDGKRSNNCTMDGGLSHVVTQSLHYLPSYGRIPPALDISGFVLRGITFTGQIIGSGPFGGVGVALSHPGKGTRFEDCAWINFTATKRLMTVGTNFLLELLGEEVGDLSIEVTLSNCLFENIVYEEELLVSDEQSLHLENCTFRNVQLSSALSQGCGLHPKGCRNLLYCRPGGNNECSISDICVENVETTGAAPIVIANETAWSSSGTNLWYGRLEYNGTLPGVGGDPSPMPSYCALTVAQLLDSSTGDNDYTCLDPPVFEIGTSPAGCLATR